MARPPRTRPTNPQLLTTAVVRTRRLTPSFQRVTLAGGDLDTFSYAGFDHWFRLFIPSAPGAPFELPGVAGKSWWMAYLALDKTVRPHCSNYTVAEVRQTDAGTELDIDVVLHSDHAGEISAPVAKWATTVEPGTPAAILDQGLLFDPSASDRSLVLACDETGVPGVRGILRRLAPSARGVAIIEVPTHEDILDITAPENVRIDWITREDAHAVPGTAALAAVRELANLTEDWTAYIVGESKLATEGRRALHHAGVPKSRITFSGYWKRAPEPAG